MLLHDEMGPTLTFQYSNEVMQAQYGIQHVDGSNTDTATKRRLVLNNSTTAPF